MRAMTSVASKQVQQVGYALRKAITRKCPLRTTCRNKSNLSDAATVDANSIPLTHAVPTLPTPVYTSFSKQYNETRITTLDNGIRVASERRYGDFCTVGVVIDSGSRFETGYPSGISHYLEKLAFNSTKSYKDKDEILQELEKHGGICDCQGSRDVMIYAASSYAKSLDAVTGLIADTVLRPTIKPDELELARMTVDFELQEIQMRPDQETTLTEMIHAAAYKENTLGLAKLCPEENIGVIDRETILKYLQSHYTPRRTVVAAVGVEHDEFVDIAQKYFVDIPPMWETDGIQGDHQPDTTLSQYTGGLVQIERDLSAVSLGPTPMPELAHFVLGLQSTSHQHDDFIACCVLNMMMGGGGSFSAGGPGKGMYTRLYTNVLNRYPWMNSCTAYNHAYADSGVFCIHSSSHPSQLRDAVSVTIREFVDMLGRISPSELSRAKKQLQSMLLMNLESRPVVFEDIGRQVLASGVRKQPQVFLKLIDAVTVDDIHRVAGDMMQSPPAVAALGNLTHLPHYSHIQEALTSRTGRLRNTTYRITWCCHSNLFLYWKFLVLVHCPLSKLLTT